MHISPGFWHFALQVLDILVCLTYLLDYWCKCSFCVHDGQHASVQTQACFLNMYLNNKKKKLHLIWFKFWYNDDFVCTWFYFAVWNFKIYFKKAKCNVYTRCTIFFLFVLILGSINIWHPNTSTRICWYNNFCLIKIILNPFKSVLLYAIKVGFKFSHVFIFTCLSDFIFWHLSVLVIISNQWLWSSPLLFIRSRFSQYKFKTHSPPSNTSWNLLIRGR